MNKGCEYCEIPKRELKWIDFFEKMVLWRKYVNDGLFKFKGGDSKLENFEEEISREQKYVYYYYFKCNCGTYIRSGVCIRSSIPILEYLKSLPKEIENK